MFLKVNHKITVIIFLLSFNQLFAQGSWLRIATPTHENLFRIIFLDTLKGWAAGDSGVIIKTTNGGLNWQIQNTPIKTRIEDIFFVNENYGWGVTWRLTEPFGTNLIKTTNGGSNWEIIEYPEENVFMNALYFSDSLNGIMGGDYGIILLTNDGGFTWKQAQIDPDFFSSLPITRFNFYSPQYGFANGGFRDISGVIWRTTDFGNTWAAYPVGPEPIQDLHIFDSLNIYGVGGDFEFGAGVVWSTNGGNYWNYRSLEMFGIAYSVDFRTRYEGWATLGFDRRFLFSSDSGRTWTTIYSPDSSAITDLCFLDSLHGFACADSGYIYKFVPQVINKIDFEKLNDNTSFRVNPIYPNPFNSKAKLSFYVDNKIHLKIKIYNVLGQLISTLFDGTVEQGLHEIGIDSSLFPSGIYLISFHSENKTQIQKFIVAK
ncbi:MAG: YCF48-related protein [Ignavibacteria bacterium]|nr:YCF48-related protein [Ignavibacteria bacterium]